MFTILLAKQRKMVLNMNVFFPLLQGKHIKTCHMLQYGLNDRICTNAVGVDHRLIVSMAVNQSISFYLAYPESAFVLFVTVLL